MLKSITLQKRRDLKRSADDGTTHIFDMIRKTRRSITDLLSAEQTDETLAFLESAPELGRGTYGEAKEVTKAIVCKITGCGSHLLGPLWSIWRSENVEPNILRFLWKHLVETRITPHIIAPLGLDHSIIEGTTERQKKDDQGIQSSLIYFMEKATAGTVRDHLTGHVSGQRFDLILKVILFQLCYTLECIYTLFPRFRHNDLKDDNVFLHKSSSQGYTRYTIHGSSFYVPNVGVTVLISDFDFASISGSLFDNYKVIEQEWETPSYNINTRKTHAADFDCFLAYVRNHFGDKISSKLKTQLKHIFGAYPKKNSYRSTVVESQGLLTTKEILMETEFFEEFLQTKPPQEIGEQFTFFKSYSKEVAQLGGDEKRHTPLFLPRIDEAIDPRDLLSFQTFRTWTPNCLEWDEEEPTVFSERACERIVGCMHAIYDIKPAPKRDIAGFGFPKDKKEIFFETVEQTGASYILDYYVPSRWWPAIYTCAFIDTAEEMDLVASNQVCWGMTQWCEFWTDMDETDYTEMELLHVALQWGWVRE
jgi:serine/threonine protein kinase